MISRTHRFHGYNALRHVYGRGQTVRNQVFSLKYAVNPKRRSYRAAVVVSRRVHKSAVVRGRIRRRLYEIIRDNAPQITQPYDIAVVVFAETVATMDTAQLRQLVTELLAKARITQPAVPVPPSDTHGIVDTKE